MKNKITVREITESAILVALAIVLDLPFFKIQLGANGGSISFSMIPLFVLALRMGFIKGFLGIGIVYSIITCLLDGWGFQTFPLDYCLAYGSISIIGLFKTSILTEKITKKGIILVILGVLISISLRLLFATISGIVFYELNFIDSLIYNSVYILPSGGIALVSLLALYKPLLVANNKFPLKSIV